MRGGRREGGREEQAVRCHGGRNEKCMTLTLITLSEAPESPDPPLFASRVRYLCIHPLIHPLPHLRFHVLDLYGCMYVCMHVYVYMENSLYIMVSSVLYITSIDLMY